MEFKAKNLEEIKAFYPSSFGRKFTDYGPDYVAFSESGLEGGFEKTETEITNGALVVLYYENLGSVKSKIIKSGGRISKDIFSFPGGRRFHFIDPLQEMSLPSGRIKRNEAAITLIRINFYLL